MAGEVATSAAIAMAMARRMLRSMAAMATAIEATAVSSIACVAVGAVVVVLGIAVSRIRIDAASIAEGCPGFSPSLRWAISRRAKRQQPIDRDAERDESEEAKRASHQRG
jgi:hypothetical protein